MDPKPEYDVNNADGPRGFTTGRVGTHCRLCAINNEECTHQNNGDERGTVDGKNIVLPNHTTMEHGTKDTVGKLPFFLISLTASVALGSSSIHNITTSQFLYNNFANQILGNNSIDSTSHPCGNKSSNDTDLDHDVKTIQEKTSHLLLLLNITSYGLGMITNVLLGAYSIVLHRRAQILIPTLGFTVRCTVLLVVAYWKLDVHWLFVGFACDGICGTFTGVYLAIFLYTTDVTPQTGKRTIGIVIVEGVKGVMGGTARLSAGFLLKHNDFVLPSAVTMGLLFIALILMCILPNHKPPMKSSDGKFGMTFRKACLIMASPFDTKIKAVRYMLFLAMFSFFIIIVVFVGIDRIMTLFFMDSPFCWSSVRIGWFDFGRILGYHLFSIICIPILYRRLPGVTLATIGLFFIMASFILYGLAHTDTQAYMGPILSLGEGMPISMLRGESSKLLQADVQGPLFACFAVIESICFFIGPVIFINLYRISLNIFRGIPFLAATAILAAPLVAMIVQQKLSASYEKNKHTAIDEQGFNAEDEHEEE